MNIHVQDLLPRLVSELGYTDKEAKMVVGDLQASSPEVQAAFEKWWETEILDEDLEIQGYTLKRLMNEYALKPIGALLTLDWLIREPVEALEALSEGYDTIPSTPNSISRSKSRNGLSGKSTSQVKFPNRSKRKQKSSSQKSQRGGIAVREKYGAQFYSTIGKKGGEALKAKRGLQFYADIGKKGGKATNRLRSSKSYHKLHQKRGEHSRAAFEDK